MINLRAKGMTMFVVVLISHSAPVHITECMTTYINMLAQSNVTVALREYIINLHCCDDNAGGEGLSLMKMNHQSSWTVQYLTTDGALLL